MVKRHRQKTGRPTVSKAAAADIVRILPPEPALKHLRATAYALADGFRLGWATSPDGCAIRRYLGRFFTRADVDTLAGVERLAAAIEAHHLARVARGALPLGISPVLAEQSRRRREAAFAVLRDEFGFTSRG